MMNSVKFRKCAVVMIVTLLIAMVGCSSGDSTPMDPEEFKTVMEEKGFDVTDQTEDVAKAGIDDVQQVYVATQMDKYEFEYYIMDSAEAAKSVYSYFTSNLDERYKGSSGRTILSSSSSKKGKYSVAASDYYCVVRHNDNTVLFVTAYANEKDDTKQILKDLGY